MLARCARSAVVRFRVLLSVYQASTDTHTTIGEGSTESWHLLIDDITIESYPAFECSKMAGVGPVLSYISPPICGHTLVAEVKWLPQIDTEKTLSGNYVWAKVGLAF